MYLPIKIAILIVHVLFSISFQLPEMSGKVVGVHDGDSITLLLDGNIQFKVRLEGKDCPESKQAFGSRAKQFTSDLAFGKQIILKQSVKDRYGRIIGYIILPDGRILNEEILITGFAWHFKKYNKDQYLAQLEDIARSEQRSLWQDTNPIPPWNFRNQ